MSRRRTDPDELRERARQAIRRAIQFAEKVHEQAKGRYPEKKARTVGELALFFGVVAAALMMLPYLASATIRSVVVTAESVGTMVRRLLHWRPRHQGKCADDRVPQRTDVPRTAEYLLYLVLAKDDREAIPGDLEEEFRGKILPKFGRLRAVVWYWKQVLWSIRAILLLRLVRIGVVAWAIELMGSRLASLVHLIWPNR